MYGSDHYSRRVGNRLSGQMLDRKFRLIDVLSIELDGGSRHSVKAMRLSDAAHFEDTDLARVCVIDDDERMLLSLENLLESAGYLVELHCSPKLFLAAGRKDLPNCLVLDIRLKTESGLDFQEWLYEANICIPVVLITGHGDTPMIVRGMKQGAIDFLAKPFRPDELLSAVANAVRLDKKQRKEAELLAGLFHRVNSLTPREYQVVSCVVSGLMNKQIAGDIGLSEATVKIHRRNAMQKLDSPTLADLVRMFELLKANGFRFREI